MDEGLLNDLLECSVCLERLDTSSRVLPCQHTFCLKCLKEIVDSHKELRCPECRVLVEVKVEELPPNVLLMRILEGMKNSAPRKVSNTGQRQPRSGHTQTLQQQCLIPTREGKQPPPHARAMYDYVSDQPGDLSFKKGETIVLQKKLDQFWYQGECSGRTGIFPITYVQVVVPLPVPAALCKALYDFRMSAPDEEGCLAFDKGSIITVHRRVDENWAEGRLEQRVGIFPIAFVEFNQPARQLITSTPLNRPVPPLPEHARASHSDHRHHTQHAHRYQMTMSTPTTQPNYQNVATMSHSHPNYHQVLAQPIMVHGGMVTTAGVAGTIVEPTHTKQAVDVIHINNKGRIADSGDRLRAIKYENYSNTLVHKPETTYQNVRPHPAPPCNFSSDSSSSVNTPPSIGTTTNSSNTSDESNEPSLPSSPDNNTERPTVIQKPEDNELNSSIGVLSLNESSTATNTSLNVSLPSESSSPKLNTSNTNNQESNESRLDVPSSSKNLRSGPDSLLNFGLGLQAALSPSHGKDGSYLTRHKEHHREKRHSLTPASHLQASTTPNRHSAEILATSLLDHTPERDRDRSDRERERERRRRRSRSNERPLPAAYLALYAYSPRRPDELELKKGGVYTVTERCRDGWYKGRSERSQRSGVFPGNYVVPDHSHRHKHDKASAVTTATASVKPIQAVVNAANNQLAPDAPPRSISPNTQPASFPWNPISQPQQSTPKSDRSKDKSKAEKSSLSTGVSLMKRLAAMKKCKSPPPAGYSMDNPVFDDGPGTSLVMTQPQHVRSGSCPVQLLGVGGSERIRHKERPALRHLTHRDSGGAEGPWHSQHRKSQSLDVTAARTQRDRHHTQPVNERFRCIVPYPPNSEYELELKVDDIVIVSKKRGDGWYKGTLQRTGKTGLFPASFVQSYPE